MRNPITVSELIALLKAVESDGKGAYSVVVEEYVIQAEKSLTVSDDEKSVSLYGRA